MSGISDAFSRSAVRRLAGARSFERGDIYAREGRVGRLTVTGDAVRATVHGTGRYRVDLRVTEEGPAWSCSCPVGLDGAFCKHCVAVALTAAGAGDADDAHPTPVDVRGYLESLEHRQLVTLVMDLAAEDEQLEARLRLDATRAQTTGPLPLRAFKDALDAAFATRDFVSYGEAHAYASTILTALDTLDGLLADGHADAVIELTEHALALTKDAVNYVDDSDGWLSTVAERIGDLHLEACAQARPDPVALAQKLFERELAEENFEVFYGAVADYADVLGDEGLSAYRRLAAEAWAQLSPLGPGDDRGQWTDRYRITTIMETLASLTGDVDATVSVLAHDLSSPWQYVRIVDVYREAGRREDALSWGERGVSTFGVVDERLVEALAEEYHQAHRSGDAVELVWQVFDRRGDFGEFRRLQRHAGRAGDWPSWRERAIARLQADITRRKGSDASELIRVRLAEGEPDTAWTEAQAHGASDGLWLELAAAREAEHPEDAIPIYQADVERAIDVKKNEAYQYAVDRLARIESLMAAADRPADFAPYVAEVRARHKPKRNLMKLFAERGW